MYPFLYVIKCYSFVAWIRKGPDSQIMMVMLEELEGWQEGSHDQLSVTQTLDYRWSLAPIC